MITPTPDELRKIGHLERQMWKTSRYRSDRILAAADAWVEQVKKAEERAFTHQVIDATLELRDENKSLRSQLAEAEKWKRLAAMLRSAVKCGEPWTATLEAEWAALAHDKADNSDRDYTPTDEGDK